MSVETRRYIFIGLNVFLFSICVWSFIVNTHALKNPYAVLLASSLPALVALGVALFVLGTIYPVSMTNRLLPFAALAVFFAPHLLPPSMIISLLSNLLAVAALVVTVVESVKNLRSKQG